MGTKTKYRSRQKSKHFGGEYDNSLDTSTYAAPTEYLSKGIDDAQINQLHNEFEVDASGQIPGQSYGTQYPPDLESGLIMPPSLPTGGSRRKKKKSKRSQRSIKKKSVRPKRSKSRRKTSKRRRKRGGALSWSKLGSDMFSRKLTPSGVNETARTVNYNVGLPKSLTHNPRVPDSVTNNSALQY